MNTTLRILHLEDSAIDAELVSSKLDQEGVSCVIDRVDTRDAFSSRLEQGGFDILLADYTLPAFDGLSALTMAREKYPDLPVIFVSGTIGEDRAVETFKNGATDYVLKSHLARLAPSIRRALKETEERIERRRVETKLRESEDRYRTLFNNSLDAVMLTVPDGGILSANPAACRMFGRTEQEICALGRDALIDPDDPRLTALLEERARTGSASGELTFVRKDGSRFPGEVSSLLFKDARGALRTSMVIRDISERKRAEEALRASKEKYRHLVENLGKEYFFYRLDVSGTMTYISPSVTDMLGYAPDEDAAHIRKWLTDAPMNREAIRHAELSFQGVQQPPYLAEVFHKDGSTRWLEVSEYPVRGGDGRVAAVEGIVRDITERKRAEDALQEFTQLNRQIIDSAQEGIVVYGKDLRYLLWNPYMERMAGVPASEVLGRHPLEVFPFLRDAGVLAATERALAGQITEMERFPYPQPDGGRGWASDKSAPLRNAAGEIVGVIATVRDITAHVEAEERVLAAAREWSVSFDAMTDGVSIHDRDQRIVNVNQALCRLLGKAREDVIGKRCHEIFHSADGPPAACPLHRLKATLQQEQAEVFEPVLGKWLSVSVAPIFDESGAAAKIVHTVRDITERKKAETERARLEAQLRHALKMEAVGTLAGGVAHDFNNILNVIIGYGSLVLESLRTDDQAKNRMREVLAAAERATSLTKRLLVFSRKDIAEMKLIRLSDVVLNMERMLVRIIGEDIEFHTEIQDDEAVILADMSQLEQVLMNLAANARDAMPQGGRLTIRTGRKEIDAAFVANHGFGVPGPYAAITVSDSGSGIDAEAQKKIFEPFFTTKGIGEGTGLGLSITYNIVKQHKGFIDVASEKEKGTTFEILLPLSEKTAEQMRAAPLLPSRGGTETILVAEDDDSARKLLQIVLESFGYTVIVASDGEDAVNKYREHRDRIQLVILDLIMPKMNGKEAADRIEAIRPGIKTLFMSGYAADLARNKPLQVEAGKFMQKPLSPQKLLARVRETLDAG